MNIDANLTMRDFNAVVFNVPCDVTYRMIDSLICINSV